jgi:hypothetical protein
MMFIIDFVRTNADYYTALLFIIFLAHLTLLLIVLHF